MGRNVIIFFFCIYNNKYNFITVFEYISSLRPYFHSLREIDTNVSLDIKLPLNWKCEDIVKLYRTIKPITQDKNDRFTLLSLVSPANKEGYDVIYMCAMEIIKFNKEEEERQVLFQTKLKELEVLFKSESIDRLRDINLINLVNGQETTTGVGMAEERSNKGLDRSGETKDIDDKRDKKYRQTKNTSDITTTA